MASHFSGIHSVSPSLVSKHFPHNHHIAPEHRNQDVLNTPFPSGLVQHPTVKITSSTSFDNFVPPHPTQPSVPRELNPIPLVSDDFVANTDSQQSPWLPPSSSSPPVHPEHLQQHLQHQQRPFPPNEDFTLFPASRQLPSRSATQPNGVSRLHIKQQRLSTPGTQFQQFTQSPVYRGSVPPSAAALNGQRRTNGQRPRPPVPLFNGQTNNMELDIDLPEFASFEGGAPASAFSSPANLPLTLDMGNSLNSSVMSVSPNDLLLTDNLMSAPGSTAMTHLTTPSGYNTSPFTDWDGSPIFSNDAEAHLEEWPSLFPDADGLPATRAPFAAAPVDQSPSLETEEIEAPKKPSKARKSSASSSPSGRHSSVSGVSARRRGKPLPPIIVDDPEDAIGVKRAKNTLAARKSRARKAERMEELESQVRELQAEKEKLAAELAHWKSVARSG